MSENWTTFHLEELVDSVFSGGTPSTTNPEYWDGDLNWLSSSETGNRFINKTAKKITALGVKESSTRLAKIGDVVVASAGQGYTRGQAAYCLVDTYINQSVISIRADNSKLDSKYLFYILTNRYNDLRQISDSFSSRGSLTIKLLKELKVSIPSLITQKRIASILYSLDYKIQLNIKMNQTLESIAKAIFKQWFIDFQFPGSTGEMENELPKGWAKKSLDEIAEFLNGLALQNFPPKNDTEYLPVIKIREIRQGITASSDKASSNIPKIYIVNNGDVLFSWSGSLEIVIWSDDKGALNQHLFKVSSDNYPKWFFYQWIKVHLSNFRAIASDKATTMGHIQRRHLKEAVVIIPPNDKMELLNTIMNPVFEKILLNKLQIKSLEKIRDSLLPKLITGQIPVNQ